MMMRSVLIFLATFYLSSGCTEREFAPLDDLVLTCASDDDCPDNFSAKHDSTRQNVLSSPIEMLKHPASKKKCIANNCQRKDHLTCLLHC